MAKKPKQVTVSFWPCGRRVAHHPHDVCPGVRAHPSTMIGRGSLPKAVVTLVPDAKHREDQ